MTKAKVKSSSSKDGKNKNLESFRVDNDDTILTTNQGVRISDNQNSLKAGVRGSTLLEDFILREKITHFDHERIPERIVHARGEAAHGFFQVYESQASLTSAQFLNDPKVKTPVFVRFSTVAGSRGSADTARDARGFSVKFYTQEGNYDLVGNNIPVFFIQDAIKFPDLIHAVKPEPNNEMPQAASAHDTFWDFISLTPEAMHMIMWVMSDRAIPRSHRMMEGFGVHTFRFINAKGVSHFVKFHWKPLLGVHALVWDEAQKLAGKDPDFHRRDLWQAIEDGNFPEWELGVQIVKEADEHKFDFDLLDATKLIPEELVPVTRIGKLTLNRNPDNYFAETEQVAFCPGHVVPGIDFSNDPLLQGRLFSYLDTQLSRLGGPNFHQIPINRPVCPFHNNQRDGIHQQSVPVGRVAYEPNSLAAGSPHEASTKEKGFVSYTEKVSGEKIRERSESFGDHFSQATLFWNSQSDAEKTHLANALCFELAKVDVVEIRERMLILINQVNDDLAMRVAAGLGLKKPKAKVEMKKLKLTQSAALSMLHFMPKTIATRKIAILADDGVDFESIHTLKTQLTKAGATVKILSPVLGELETTSKNKFIPIDNRIVTDPSVTFDAVYIAGGADSVSALLNCPEAVDFIRDAYQHYKTIAASADAKPLLVKAGVNLTAAGILIGTGKLKALASKFIAAIMQHRHWDRKI
jgi:catalase